MKNINEIFEAYLNLVWNHWLSDVEVLSIWWVWATILPAAGYILFMLVKWTLLTMPAWIPIKLIRMLFVRGPSYYTSTGDYKKDLLNARLAILDRINKESKKN
jgi:hypothetical protein